MIRNTLAQWEATMANDSYEQQVAAMRQQRTQEQYRVDYNQAVYGREEALRNRQEIEQQAARTSDPNERAELADQWHYHDAEYQECDNEVRRLTPQQPNPNLVRAAQQDQVFYRREGQNGINAMDKAHNYLVSRGWPSCAPRTLQGARDLVQMYGSDSRISGVAPVRYDPNEQIMTRDEAARISGFKDYATLYAELKRQGRVK